MTGGRRFKHKIITLQDYVIFILALYQSASQENMLKSTTEQRSYVKQWVTVG